MTPRNVIAAAASRRKTAPEKNVLVVASVEHKVSPPQVHLGDLPFARTWPRLAKRWRERLAKTTDWRPLTELYRGGQWKATLALLEAAGPATRMYVVSPGLGLRPLDWVAPAYSARFASGPNSPWALARRYDWPRRRAARDWWRALTGGGGWERVLDSMGEAERLFVVLPVNTWRAVGESLAEALSSRRELLPRTWLLCTGRVQLPDLLTPRLLPAQDVDWPTLFGCPRSAGSLTLAHWLLDVPLKDWRWDEVVGRIRASASSAAQSSSGSSTITAP